MLKFYEDVENTYCKLEDVAGALIDNPMVRAYFVERYDYDPEVDDNVSMLVRYMCDKYSI